MLIIEVKRGKNGKSGIEKALKQLKKKIIRTRTIQEIRDRRYFTKKSTKRRLMISKAKFKEKKRREEEGY